jgi:UPF0755 protein
MKKYWWIFLLAAPLFGVLLVGIKVYHSIQLWTYDGPEIVFEVKPGEGFSSINGRLKRNQLISSAKIFHRYAQVNNHMTKFKAGKYKIKAGLNMLAIVDTLTSGQGITTLVTIPEGKNLFEIAQILERKNICSSSEFIKYAKDPNLAKELGIPSNRIEGYLYPDTYRFSPKSQAKQVIQIMVNLFRKKVGKLNFSMVPLQLSQHQVVILSSIVEKETGAPSERPRIAGVFINRLKKRIRLQSDPTTIYGIWENFNGNLRKKHLLEKTPYNTYKIPGLPIGPISNPGLASLNAVITPEKHSYLYFVSQNDGTHVFSKTYKEHLAAVNKFQKNSRARKGKSWRDLSKKLKNKKK